MAAESRTQTTLFPGYSGWEKALGRGWYPEPHVHGVQKFAPKDVDG